MQWPRAWARTATTTLTKFGCDLRDLTAQLGGEEVSLQRALVKHSKTRANEYSVEWAKLAEYMRKAGLYDPDARD